MMIEVLSASCHVVLLGALLALSASWLWLASLPVRYLRYRDAGRKHEQDLLHLPLPSDDHLPRVLIQLPIYNESKVARRLVEAVAALDWPREKLLIQFLDDSTDETTSILRGQAAHLRGRGCDVRLIHRDERTDFKAGALREGLEQAGPDCDYVAVFDADFAPARDFLRVCLRPLIADPRLAFVQARWGFTNGGENLVTLGQRVILDAYFEVMQTAQCWSGTVVDYNGTCAVWRRAAIDDAGGWQTDTLGEDVDLSYRAQLRGWSAQYLSRVVVPGELPDTLAALQVQQSRWGMSWGQQARKHWRGLWRSRLSLGRKLVIAGQMLATTSGVAFYVAAASGAIGALLGSWTPLTAWLAVGAILESAGALAVMAIVAEVSLGHSGVLAAMRNAMAGLLLFGLMHLRAAISVLGGLRGQTAAFARTPKKGKRTPALAASLAASNSSADQR